MKKEWPVTLDAYREAISEEWEVDRVSTLKDQATGGRSNRPKFVIDQLTSSCLKCWVKKDNKVTYGLRERMYTDTNNGLVMSATCTGREHGGMHAQYLPPPL